MDHTALLPDELLSRICDYVTPNELLPVTRLSRRLRAIAQGHPSFWREIAICAVSDGALDLLRARLRCRPHSIFNIGIMLPRAAQNRAVTEVVLPLLVQHIHRIEFLFLFLNMEIDRPAFQALTSGSAPRLRRLIIEFFSSPEHPCSVPLPGNMFRASAPLLRDISLKNVHLCHRWPAAFHSVVKGTFDFGHDYWGALHLDDIASLDHLKELAIRSTSMFPASVCATSVAQAVVGQLDILELCLTQGTPLHLLHWKEMASIPDISTTDRLPATVLMFLSHLESDLDMTLRADDEWDEGTFRIAFSSRASGLRRTLRDYLSWYAPCTSHPWITPGLNADEVLRRVVHLTIDADMWAKVGAYLRPLPTCRELVLEVDPLVVLSTLCAIPLRCPALQHATLHSEIAVIHYAAGELAAFIETALGATQRVQLTLERVIIDRDRPQTPDPAYLHQSSAAELLRLGSSAHGASTDGDLS